MVNLSGGLWRRWLLVAIALLLVSFSTSSCRQLFLAPEQSPLSAHNSLLEFVPKRALLAGTIDTTVKPDKAWLRSTLGKSLPQSIDSWLSPLELSFTQDIRPWLGESVAFAITSKDIDHNQNNGRQTGYLLATDITDSEQLREFLELFWQRQVVAGTEPTLITASGVPIIAGHVAADSRYLATAVVGDRTLLVANDIKVLQQSLRVAQAPALQLASQGCCTPIWINLRIPEFVDWLGLATPAHLRLTSAPEWQQLNATAALYAQKLVIETQLTSLNNLSISEPTALWIESDASQPNQYVPDSLAWVGIGSDFPSLWTTFWQELTHYKQLPLPLQQGQQWLSTQLAGSLLKPIAQLSTSNYVVGQWDNGNWLMAVANTNPTTTKQLDDIAMQQGLTVSQLSLMGQSVTAWSRLSTRLDTRNRETTVETDLVALHTHINDCDVFATSIDGLTASLEASSSPLFKTQQFQHTVQLTNDPSHGYVYGTWDELERLLASNRWFSLVEPILQPWSQSIDAISITSHGQTVNQLTGTVSILLKN